MAHDDDDEPPPRTLAEEAQYLALSENTLNLWRRWGKGPRWVKVGRHIRYPRSDTQQWLDAGADSPDQARTDSAGGTNAPAAKKPTATRTGRARAWKQ
jgi:hypothetical protein